MSTLITSIETIRQYVKVNVGTDFETIEPYVKEAELKYIIPVISQELYDRLISFLEDSNSGSGEDDLDELLLKIERPLANLATLIFIPIASVQVVDGGIVVTETANYKPASQYKIEQLKESLATIGFDAIDDLLRYLEENAESFPEWTDSESYTEYKELFLKTGKDFQKHYNINNSRQTFSALRHTIKYVQDTYIKPLYDEVTDYEAILENQDADENEEEVALIRSAVAYLSIFEASKELPVQVRGSGICLIAYDSSFQSPNSEQPADKNRLSTLAESAEKKGLKYIQNIKELLDDDDSDDDEDPYFENDSDNKSFFT